jgi:two-component system phosphate regulon response regulator PhoB
VIPPPLHKSVMAVSTPVTRMGGFGGEIKAISEEAAHPRDLGGRRVLIIDRDVTTTRALHNQLVQADFVVSFDSGVGALAAVERDNPHLVVLDWNIPGVRSPTLLREIQRAGRDRRRIVAVSEPCDEQLVLAGFELGVDDFVLKPYSVPEVVARIRAILRPQHSVSTPEEVLKFHDLQVDFDKGALQIRGEPISLRPLEFRLLYFLMQHAERVFSRRELLIRIWGNGTHTDYRAVDVTVQRARKALTPLGCADYLQTVRGIGYRLSAPSPSISPRDP